MVGKRKAQNWLFLEYIHLFWDKYSKMAENRPKSAGTSTGQSGGASRHNRTSPNQTVTCCQIFTSFKFANGAGAGHGARQAIFATSENTALQRFSNPRHKIIHQQPLGRFSPPIRSSQRTLSHKLNCGGANHRFFAVQDRKRRRKQ
jgi:hypothetical protein